MINQFTKILLILLLIISASCSKKENIKEDETQSDVNLVYQEAEKLYQNKEYIKSAEEFSKIYIDYPYSELSTKSKLLEARSYFEFQDYEMCLAALDEFIKFHPVNRDMDYAYYLRAMSYYYQISDVTRDQSQTSLAKQSIQESLERFPNSKYTKDLKYKLDLILDHLAGSEMGVARFYQKKGDLISSIKRFKNVVDNYPQTKHAQEALARLVECYLFIGLKDDALHYAKILGYNNPESDWYDYSYNLIKNAKSN